MDSVLTVRLDTDLKERGTRVMERHGLTPSQSVRKLFAYAAQNDTLPFESEQRASRKDISDDVKEALAQKWADFENCLVAQCVSRVHADDIITRNVKDFTRSSIRAITPEQLFEELEARG